MLSLILIYTYIVKYFVSYVLNPLVYSSLDQQAIHIIIVVKEIPHTGDTESLNWYGH